MRDVMMISIPTKTSFKDLEEYIKDFNTKCEVQATYNFKDRILELVHKKDRCIIACNTILDAMIILQGVFVGIFKYNDTQIDLRGLKHESKS